MEVQRLVAASWKSIDDQLLVEMTDKRTCLPAVLLREWCCWVRLHSDSSRIDWCIARFAITIFYTTMPFEQRVHPEQQEYMSLQYISTQIGVTICASKNWLGFVMPDVHCRPLLENERSRDDKKPRAIV